MRRGEVWTVVGGKDDAGKPRPVVILQDDHFDATASASITISCLHQGSDRGPPVPVARRAECGQRAADAVPPDSRQDHHGSESEDRRSDRATKTSCD
jgi:mRNA interferase MazF